MENHVMCLGIRHDIWKHGSDDCPRLGVDQKNWLYKLFKQIIIFSIVQERRLIILIQTILKQGGKIDRVLTFLLLFLCNVTALHLTEI